MLQEISDPTMTPIMRIPGLSDEPKKEKKKQISKEKEIDELNSQIRRLTEEKEKLSEERMT